MFACQEAAPAAAAVAVQGRPSASGTAQLAGSGALEPRPANAGSQPFLSPSAPASFQAAASHDSDVGGTSSLDVPVMLRGAPGGLGVTSQAEQVASGTGDDETGTPKTAMAATLMSPVRVSLSPAAETGESGHTADGQALSAQVGTTAACELAMWLVIPDSPPPPPPPPPPDTSWAFRLFLRLLSEGVCHHLSGGSVACLCIPSLISCTLMCKLQPMCASLMLLSHL